MTWTSERRAAQAARVRAWHATRNPERAAARKAEQDEAREIARARSPSNRKPPLENPLWRKLVELIIARAISGESVADMSLASALKTTRAAIQNTARALIKRGYLGASRDSFTHMTVLTPLADADGNPWQREGELIRLEQRGDHVVKVCPPRTAAGALKWPQKLQRRGA